MRPEDSLRKLFDYCRSEKWAGYDPYDGLKSPLARFVLFRSKFPRTVLTQLVKRSPFNLRPALGISKGLNPKGVALSARGLILLDRLIEGRPEMIEAITGEPGKAGRELLDWEFRFLMGKLMSLKCPGYEQMCWGYDFDWQSRAFFAPKGTPNAVVTVTAAQAHMDWYDATGFEQKLKVVESSCRFILDELNRTESESGHCFSYTPIDRSCVHNVNLLAAELLARFSQHSPEPEYRSAAIDAVNYTVNKQRPDGSWPYGEDASQKWIDGFHTGFILVSLKNIIRYLGKSEWPQWNEALSRGYEFYRKSFFLADHRPKYYHNRVFPLDVHSASEAIIAFLELSEIFPEAADMAEKELSWTIDRMQDPSGFFYYQIHRLHRIRTPFMRWGQAWMLYALSSFLARGSEKQVQTGISSVSLNG